MVKLINKNTKNKKNLCFFLAKLQLHNRRINRIDTRHCPICYQTMPMNTDEEYYFTHVQQCSRKVKNKKKHLFNKIFELLERTNSS